MTNFEIVVKVYVSTDFMQRACRADSRITVILLFFYSQVVFYGYTQINALIFEMDSASFL